MYLIYLFFKIRKNIILRQSFSTFNFLKLGKHIYITSEFVFLKKRIPNPKFLLTTLAFFSKKFQ